MEANSVLHPITGVSQEYRHLSKGEDEEIWIQSFTNELGQLAQGIRDIEGTNTIHFIPKEQAPFTKKKVTYGKIVCDIKNDKAEKHHTRLTVVDNLLEFTGNASTPVATITTTKCLLNSIVSTPKAKGLVADIKHFYLNNILPDPGYMKLPISIIPQEIIDAYNLTELADEKGWVYLKIVKGMYGLIQAGKIANDELIIHMAKYGYRPVRITPGLWKHDENDTIFTLVVDDFLVQYISEAKVEHFLNALRAKYTITVDRQATKHIGLTLQLDYNKRTIILSMPGYVRKALLKCKHILPTLPEHSPYTHIRPTYGAKVQYEEPCDSSDLLPPSELTLIQQIVGTILYYGIALDNTLLVELNDISQEQPNATSNTSKKTAKLLNYLATHPDVQIKYHASGMILHVHSDASYLSVNKERGIHFLSDLIPNPQDQNYVPIMNGILHVVL